MGPHRFHVAAKLRLLGHAEWHLLISGRASLDWGHGMRIIWPPSWFVVLQHAPKHGYYDFPLLICGPLAWFVGSYFSTWMLELCQVDLWFSQYMDAMTFTELIASPAYSSTWMLWCILSWFVVLQHVLLVHATWMLCLFWVDFWSISMLQYTNIMNLASWFCSSTVLQLDKHILHVIKHILAEQPSVRWMA